MNCVSYSRVSLLLFVLSIASISGAVSQDIQFSQFYAATPYISPAFAGSAHQTRAMVHQRLQWPRLDAKYTTSLFAADHYFEDYRSGFGIMALHDVQGRNTLSSTEIAAMYSYEIYLNSEWTLRPGIQLGYMNRTLDYSSLYFSSQLDSYGNISGANLGTARANFVDVSSGAILYNNNLWVGFSAHHINNPNQSLVGEESRLPVKYAFIGGYKIYISEQKSYSNSMDKVKEISVTPSVNYKFQGKSDQVDVGLYGLYDQMVVGVWYRGIPVLKRYDKGFPNHESMVLLAGWKFENVSVSYSYDFVVSNLAIARAGGAHEINITYFHNPQKRKKPKRSIPCPKF